MELRLVEEIFGDLKLAGKHRRPQVSAVYTNNMNEGEAVYCSLKSVFKIHRGEQLHLPNQWPDYQQIHHDD